MALHKLHVEKKLQDAQFDVDCREAEANRSSLCARIAACGDMRISSFERMRTLDVASHVPCDVCAAPSLLLVCVS